jgi:hypothetical protein
MNKQLRKQITKEYDKICDALEVGQISSLKNKYLNMVLQDVRDLYYLYYALDINDINGAVSIFSELDTAVCEEIPNKIWDYLDKKYLEINGDG